MDRKELFGRVLERVEEGKRQEASERLASAATRAEMAAIMAEYGVDLSSPEAAFGEGWQDASHELTDEELEQVAGGGLWESD